MSLPPEVDPLPNIIHVANIIGEADSQFTREMAALQTKAVIRALLEVRDGVSESLDTLRKVAEALDGKMPTWVDPPDGSSAPGEVGQLAYSDEWLYVCTAADTWRRVHIANFP